MRRIVAVYFSPVNNTRRITEKIAQGISERLDGLTVETLDFTLPRKRSAGPFIFSPDEIVVFGMPTYAGRLPNKLLPFVQEMFQGGGAHTVAVVTFGNRSCDSSLRELAYELDRNGFKVFAAGAFPCQHVFSDKLATGRPGDEDMREIERISHKIAEKMLRRWEVDGEGEEDFLVKVDDGAPVEPYYIPKKEDGSPAVFLKAKPVTDKSKCNKCGICKEVCPLESIAMTGSSEMLNSGEVVENNPSPTEDEGYPETPGICIKCHACIKKCPCNARHFIDGDFLSHVKMLEENFTEPKKIVFYI